MHLLLLLTCLVGLACSQYYEDGRFAQPQGRNFQPNRQRGFGDRYYNIEDNYVEPRCGPGRVRNNYGECVAASATGNLFYFEAKPNDNYYQPPPVVPRPKIVNDVFILKTPKQDPIHPLIIPPPERINKFFILSQRPNLDERKVIHAPTPPQVPPKVIYYNYNENDDEILPGGINLQSILNTGSQGNQGFEDARPNNQYYK